MVDDSNQLKINYQCAKKKSIPTRPTPRWASSGSRRNDPSCSSGVPIIRMTTNSGCRTGAVCDRKLKFYPSPRVSLRLPAMQRMVSVPCLLLSLVAACSGDSGVDCIPVPRMEILCDNSLDDDGDGLADCDDTDCDGTPGCRSEELGLAACSDGRDNDGNGFADCSDFGCTTSGDASILEYCESLPTETTLADCSDREDNDGNGFTDCGDFRCSMSEDAAIVEFCADLPEETSLADCSDGEDTDYNGFADCADRSCFDSDDVDVREFCDANRIPFCD